MSRDTPPTSRQPRTTEDKLFQACLNACIVGIQELPVDRRGDSATTYAGEDTHNHLESAVIIDRAPTPLVESQSTQPLPSPPLSPPTSPVLRAGRPSLSSTIDATMDHYKSDSATNRGPPSSPLSTQDARNNLAAQPGANASGLKLKKNAVKIVGPADLAPSAQPNAPATMPSVSGPVKVQPKVSNGPVAAKDTTPATPTHSSAADAALDALYSRLMAKASTPKSSIKVSKPVKGTDKVAEKVAEKMAEKASERMTAKVIEKPTEKPTEKLTEKPTEKMADKVAETTTPQEKSDDIKKNTKMSKEQLETVYLSKAIEFVAALPTRQKTPAHAFKIVTEKLHALYDPKIKLSSEKVATLKMRYASAVVSYVNEVLKTGEKPLTANFVMRALEERGGNLVFLCSELKEEKYITFKDLVDVSGLCNAIIEVPIEVTETANPSTSMPITEKPKLELKDLAENMATWPSQEKRENAPTCRTCILKGVSGVASINQLQALVWGGRLESISMPDPGSDSARVKFLTADGFDKYYEATQNGIKIAGDKNKVVFVEKTSGPNSINDVIRNCGEGDASRCVRAIGAEEDWADAQLLQLARGSGQSKRVVDCIKRGKTARNHPYIEFRFADIFHALQFKRLLTDDEEWEHCNISYALDPCETAHGVHYKDEAEADSTLLA